ncbi:MAG: hypothetical protein H6636_05635 [Anaerolineales bacterium]|nr:hypothetical protein [Anaerolineales bacterium]
MNTSPPSSPLRLFIFSLLFFTLLLVACTATPSLPTPTPLPTEVFPRPTKTPLILPPTWTPGPPTETSLPPTPFPTYTWTPLPTPFPTLAPSATSFPPVRIASADEHPSAVYTLLFLERGVVRAWNKDGTVTDLVTLPGTTDRLDRVDMFDVSQGGFLVAILRHNQLGETEIVLYDRAAQAIRWTQTIPVANATSIKISFDNFWVAFGGSGTASKPGVVGAILVEAPEQTLTLAECKYTCENVRWRFVNNQIVWSDEGGIWQVDPFLGKTQIPVSLLQPPLQILNSDGSTVTGVFKILAFSPLGQYIMLSKGPYPDTIPTIYDLESGRAADIPGPFLYSDPGSSVAWMYEDKLAVARAGLATDGRPSIEVWQIAPATAAFFVKERTSYVGSSPSQAPFGLARLPDGGVRFGLLDFSTTSYTRGNGIYFSDPRDDDLSLLNNLPYLRIKQALWIPDGSGVLMLTANKVYYIPTNGGFAYEMDAFLGLGACCYAWAP